MSEKKVVIERVYTINLRRTREVSRTKRAPYAIKLVRKFIARHLHVEPEYVKISNEVNEVIWARSIEKPPRKIKVKVIKYEDGIVRVELYKEEVEIEKKVEERK